ncbi:glycosyltransferase family 29 protein [Chelativorans sp. Marseille-P2723]|uniref:glycosyltransferase family 29 protein n=1 Tax=Chelativorans sp. Marseille-P2723 TaxID=2709133 RepID=UPI001570EF14|nr:glycosyltransferase family 29 protein [Chelativorans sp. Marseille-P2723]
MNPQTVAIVGNGPVDPEAASAIDSSGCVIRFNRPPHGPEAGSRTDILFFMNSGKSAQTHLSDPSYLAHPAVAGCRQVILPYDRQVIARYHPKPNFLSRLKGRHEDWTAKAIEVFCGQGKEVAILPTSFYELCCDELRIAPEERRQAFPSTGFLAIVYAMKEFPRTEWPISLYGFGWCGWKRHDWRAERKWVEEKARSGQLTVV